MYGTIFAVDFDGTLCKEAYPNIGEPNTELIEFLKNEQKIGNKVILWTCRCGESLDAAIKWCAKQELKFDAINENLPGLVAVFGNDSRKIYADVYIDDRSIRPTL